MASIVTNLLTGGVLQGISGLINTIRGKSPEDAAKLQELAWIKSIIVGAGVIVLHPIARKLGLDI